MSLTPHDGGPADAPPQAPQEVVQPPPFTLIPGGAPSLHGARLPRAASDPSAKEEDAAEDSGGGTSRTLPDWLKRFDNAFRRFRETVFRGPEVMELRSERPPTRMSWIEQGRNLSTMLSYGSVFLAGVGVAASIGGAVFAGEVKSLPLTLSLSLLIGCGYFPLNRLRRSLNRIIVRHNDSVAQRENLDPD